MYAQDDDGEIREVTREELLRIWVWKQGKLHSKLIYRDCEQEAIEAHRAEGWHAWITQPLIVEVVREL